MRPQSRQCFLADDLSGALEVGAVFHRLGRDVSISLRRDAPPDRAPERILGFDLNTRVLPSDAAYATVLDLCRSLQAKKETLIAKKIDSTMRGWIGQEIQAVLDSGIADAVALCPTNPTAERTVEDGRLLIAGTPVHQTAFCQDPAFPIGTSRMDRILTSQTTAAFRQCPIDLVRSGQTLLAEWLEKAMAEGGQILSFDAVTEDDLEIIVRATRSLDANLLPCGSGAMAAAVGRVLGSRERVLPSAGEKPTAARHRTAFLIGSAHPASKAQFENLKRNRAVTTHRFDPNQTSTWEEVIETTSEALTGKVIALLPMDNGQVQDKRETSLRIQDFYTLFAERLRSTAGPLNLFVTGGETARTVIDSLALETLDIVQELEPGVGVAVSGRPDKPQTTSKTVLITKPGGFGNPDTLIGCFDYLLG